MRVYIPGPPVAKGRPRSTVLVPSEANCARMMAQQAGNGPFKPRHLRQILQNIRPHSFTPAKTRTWEAECAIRARARMRSAKPFEGPLSVLIVVDFQPAKSWPAWKQQAAIGQLIGHTTTPDSDNVEKAVKDALNGVVFHDDCQIVETTHRKRYARQPGVTIVVRQLDMRRCQITSRGEL